MTYNTKRTKIWKMVAIILCGWFTFILMKKIGGVEGYVVLGAVSVMWFMLGIFTQMWNFKFRRSLKKSTAEELIDAGQTRHKSITKLMSYIKKP